MLFSEIRGGALETELIEETLRISKIPGPVGYTERVTEYVERELLACGYEPKRMNKGGLTVDLGGEGPITVFSAHLDVIGAMVRRILPNGHLHISALGGLVLANLDAENCVVCTRDGREYPGTLQLDEPSTHANGEVRTRERNFYTMEVVIDRRVTNAEETADLGIQAGDYVIFDPKTVESGGFIKSRGLDDRAQAAAFLVYARWLKKSGHTPAKHVVFQFADWEEVGIGGATGLPEGTVEFIAADVGIIGKELNGNEYSVSIVAKDSVMETVEKVQATTLNIAEDAKVITEKYYEGKDKKYEEDLAEATEAVEE